MRHVIWTLFALLLIAALPTIALADDHGDTCGTSTQLLSWDTGAIDHAGDKDVFHIELAIGGELSVISGTHDPIADLMGELLDSSCQVIASDDNSGADYNFFINRTLSAGTYFLRVSHVNPRQSNWNYAVETIFFAAADDHGNDPTAATAVSAPSTASASLEYPGDIDCFSIQPAAAGTLTVATAGNLDTWGVLFENGSDVAADDDSGTGDNFSITHPAVPGMTYVICAEAYDTTSTGAYSLQVSQTTGDDHGDTSAAATTVGLISSTQGALGHSGDVDVFQFVVPSPQWVDLETWGSTDTKGTLKNSSGVVQDSDDDCADGLSLNFCISHYLSSGTYTIEVEHYSTVGTGSYSLMMNPIQ